MHTVASNSQPKPRKVQLISIPPPQLPKPSIFGGPGLANGHATTTTTTGPSASSSASESADPKRPLANGHSHGLNHNSHPNGQHPQRQLSSPIDLTSSPPPTQEGPTHSSQTKRTKIRKPTHEKAQSLWKDLTGARYYKQSILTEYNQNVLRIEKEKIDRKLAKLAEEFSVDEQTIFSDELSPGARINSIFFFR